MKKNKRAFTLAEVLIALSVTGIVAAFVIPQAVVEIQKKSAGLKLARTVEQIELGCKNLLEYENSKVTNGSYYTGITQIPDMSLAKLASFIGLKPDSTDASVNSFHNYANIPTSILPHAYAAVNPGSPAIDTTTGANANTTSGLQADTGVQTIIGTQVKPTPSPGIGEDTPPPTTESWCSQFGFTGAFSYISGSSREACEKKIKESCKYDCESRDCAPYRDQDYCDNQKNTQAELQQPDPYENLTGNVEQLDNKAKRTYKSGKGNIGIYFLDPLNINQKSKDATVVQLLIDTNGIKNKPNMYGKDVFQFDLINSGKLKPYGADVYKTDCSDTKITDGKACTARVLAEGYKINY